MSTRLGLATSVIVLPQRQPALVAKQAAEVDVLSRGRLILGVGIGWNQVEYEALGMNFKDRGKRIEEQIAVLRALWTEEIVDFKGRWHRIDRAGINPLPVQRPIPIVGLCWDRQSRRSSSRCCDDRGMAAVGSALPANETAAKALTPHRWCRRTDGPGEVPGE